ncbi:MAG TPA: iron-sulfur cluster insertion protein ErpA [Gammaproteobacteria bacterium]|nr:iron-sulfur cluster insertion protein ErpA [Gammaproteobacteria bacterium]|tara:strand:- start:4550 stop:4906 length:357 start_codon:yes stop_codon:yes gene_type:complete
MTTSQQLEVGTEVVVSDRAATRVSALIADEGDTNLKLRVFVSGGGCNGFSYGFTFDDAVQDDDAEFQQGPVTLLVDAMSYPYLVGATIDYVEDLSGSQFVVTNPNASSTCGCGNSFAV